MVLRILLSVSDHFVITQEESDMILQDTESSAAAFQDGIDRSKVQNFVNMNVLAKRLEPICKLAECDSLHWRPDLRILQANRLA